MVRTLTAAIAHSAHSAMIFSALIFPLNDDNYVLNNDDFGPEIIEHCGINVRLYISMMILDWKIKILHLKIKILHLKMMIWATGMGFQVSKMMIFVSKTRSFLSSKRGILHSK